MGRAAVGEQHVGLEEPPEDKAAEGGGRGVGEERGLGGGAGPDKTKRWNWPRPKRRA